MSLLASLPFPALICILFPDSVLGLHNACHLPALPLLSSQHASALPPFTGISGLSMGGVHACMTAGLYAGDLACTPLLAPRSAAVAYCDGAMHAAMAWDGLSGELDGKNHIVGQVREQEVWGR